MRFLTGWEGRYKYIIDLGRETACDGRTACAPRNIVVRGCQARYGWQAKSVTGNLFSRPDKRCFMRHKGLLRGTRAYNGKTLQPQGIPILKLFEQLNLIST